MRWQRGIREVSLGPRTGEAGGGECPVVGGWAATAVVAGMAAQGMGEVKGEGKEGGG